MKKITLLFILCLTCFSASFGQCTDANIKWPTNNVTVFNDGTAVQIATDNYPDGEYSVIVGLEIGNIYEITSTNTTSVYLTIQDATTAGFPVITNAASTVTFTATSEAIFVSYHLTAACDRQASDNTTTTITCTSCSCSSTDPDIPVLTSPVNGATNVAIDVSDPASKTVNFQWTDNGEATSYDLDITGVGTYADVGNTVNAIHTWEYDTTYDWTITSKKNCTSYNQTSSNFTFTTESDPALSTEEFKTKLFTIYPNPTAESLNIETNETINSVTVYNLLGKQIMFIEGNQILNNTLNVGNLTKGIYFITIEANGKNEKLKFIKQ
jgi:hypothetical protein